MEVKCPHCHTTMFLKEGAVTFPCPSCGRPLEIVVDEAGFAIVGIDQEALQRAALKPQEDPFLDYYTKWQVAAGFTLATAVCFAILLFNDIKSSYLTYGFYFWKNPDNLILIYIVGTLFLLCLLTGGGMFLFAGKKKKMYREALKDRETAKDGSGFPPARE